MNTVLDAIYAVPLLVVLLLAGCASGSEEAGWTPMPDLERLPPSAVGGFGTREGGEVMRFDGKDFLVARVWSAEELNAPLTQKPCAYWWYEAAWEEPDVSHHITTQISKNTLYVEMGGKLIEVGQAKRGFAPQYVKTFARGEEPEHMRFVDWNFYDFPEATYEEWTLVQGGEYRIRVEVFGSAYEDDSGDIVYETYYHYTFLELLD
ncbi:MAG TPA: hypothetical protein VM054_05250 [bacterium]|nr:hypothetical protein [bacterium]